MTTMNISLPEAMKRFVEEQVKSGGYGTASEYVRMLIREAQLRAARQELDAKLLEGLDSGPAAPMTREDWDELKRRVWERHEQNKNP
jgi:antitoxin ParD1/3/4